MNIDKPWERDKQFRGMSVDKRVKILTTYAKLCSSDPKVTVGEVQIISKEIARLRELKRAHNKHAINRLVRAVVQ